MTNAELYAPYAAWRDAALADGWVEIPGGVWGVQEQPLRIDPLTGSYAQTGDRSPGDNTVHLRKGDMVVWLVDRVSFGRRETWTSGWFDKYHAMPSVPEEYDVTALDSLRSVCTKCGVKVEPGSLTYLTFAAYVCQECNTPQLRAEVDRMTR